MIVMLADVKLAEDSLNWLGFLLVLPAAFFVILMIRDIKILKPTLEKEKARKIKEEREKKNCCKNKKMLEKKRSVQ